VISGIGDFDCTIKNCFAKAFESSRNYELASVDNNDSLDELISEQWKK